MCSFLNVYKYVWILLCSYTYVSAGLWAKLHKLPFISIGHVVATKWNLLKSKTKILYKFINNICFFALFWFRFNEHKPSCATLAKTNLARKQIYNACYIHTFLEKICIIQNKDNNLPGSCDQWQITTEKIDILSISMENKQENNQFLTQINTAADMYSCARSVFGRIYFLN